MKVLVIRNAYEYDFGGAERLAVHMAAQLKVEGLDTEIISNQRKLLEYATLNDIPARKGLWWSRQSWNGWRVALFPLYLIWQGVLYLWYLQVFLREKPQAVHIFSKDDFIAATFAARTLGIRVMWTDCADLKYVLANHTVWYKNPVGKLVFTASKYAKAILLVSNSEKALIEHELGKPVPPNYLVVHIAGKDEKVDPITRETKDLDAVIFSSTSRLVIAKGISELIVAFNKLSRDSGNYRLWLIGEGPDEAKFKKEAEGNPHIHFLGHQEAPLRHVLASDIFVQPTYHEGFSLSLAEAAMLGKPMIATNVGGNPELVNSGNGILVNAKDPDDLFRAMKALGEDRSMQKSLGLQARQDYKNHFDFNTIVKQEILPLYEKDSD